MSEWKLKKIGEVADLYQGLAINSKTKHLLVEDGPRLPLLRIKDLLENSEEFFVDHQNAPKKSLVDLGDLIFTRTGQVGYVFNNRKGVLHNNCFKIIPKDERVLSSDFLYHYFNRENVRDYLESISAGSVQPDMNHSIFKLVEVPVPPIEEQRAIASVLSSLDDKIDLLHRQNQTLEQMAETLFRQWFVEEADEAWEKDVLGDEFDFIMGQSPPGSSFNEDGIGTPMYQGNRDFGFRFPENRVFTTEPKRFAEKFDTLISVRAPVGEQNMAYEKCCIGRGVAAFRYKANPAYYTYTFFKMKSLMDEIKQFNETGTVFGSISKNDFQEMEVTIPPIDKVEKFQNEIKPIDDKIITNCTQIRTLTALRDTLLSKLMSGEVRIKTDE